MNYYSRNDMLTIQEENERDMAIFKELYPQNMQLLQEIIEDECDRLEYQGSRMFDEYPDKNMLRSLVHKIYDRAKVMWGIEDEAGATLQSEESASVMQRPPFGPGPRPPFGPGTQRPPQRPPYRPPQRPNQNNLFEDVIQVLLFNELARRRCRYRNCRYNFF